MIITVDQLAHIMPASTHDNRMKFIDPINHAAERFKINTPARMGMWLAQVGVESAYLAKVVESTYYKDAAYLARMFPHDFSSKAEALNYIKNPIKCANRIYANQNGNGPESSGDGYKYRGRGLIQITGRENYDKCGQGIGLDLIGRPELLEEPEAAALSAGWFWNVHGCNEFADVGLFTKTTRRVNGGQTGASERLILWNAAQEVLSV